MTDPINLLEGYAPICTLGVSDEQPKAENPKGLSPQGASAARRETPFPTSPLNEGAVEEVEAFVLITTGDGEGAQVILGREKLRKEVRDCLWCGDEPDDELEDYILRILDIVSNPAHPEWEEYGSPPRLSFSFEDGGIEIVKLTPTTLLTNLAEAQRERAIYEDRWQSEFKSRLTAEARAEAAEARLSHLQTRLEEVEGATIERCAKIAERFAAANRDISTAYQEGRADAGDAIAAHIRAALQPKGESRDQ